MIKTISIYVVVIVLLITIGLYIVYPKEDATYENGTYVLSEVNKVNEYVYRT